MLPWRYKLHLKSKARIWNRLFYVDILKGVSKIYLILTLKNIKVTLKNINIFRTNDSFVWFRFYEVDIKYKNLFLFSSFSLPIGFDEKMFAV